MLLWQLAHGFVKVRVSVIIFASNKNVGKGLEILMLLQEHLLENVSDLQMNHYKFF